MRCGTVQRAAPQDIGELAEPDTAAAVARRVGCLASK